MKKLLLAGAAAGLLLLGLGCAGQKAAPVVPAPAANTNTAGANTNSTTSGGANTKTAAPSTGATAPLPTDQGGDVNGPIGPGPGGF